MVLCDGGFLLTTGVSMMMNGVCCVYQMNGERELRQAMRDDIRDEWRQQREVETRAKQEQERETERLRLLALEKRYKLLHGTTRQLTPVCSRSIIGTNEKSESSPGSRGRWVGVSSRSSPRSLHRRAHDAMPCLLDEEL